MRGGSGGSGREEEAKVMGPLFPRLHVNDTDKGGPRAPPRNKMALYEQLSIPSQRFGTTTYQHHNHHHHGIPTVPPPPPRHNPAAPVPSTSSSQGVGNERASFTSYYLPSTPTAPSARETYLHSSNRKSIVAPALNSERKSSSVLTKRPHPGPEISRPAAAESGSSLLRANNFSTLNSSRKTSDDEDDFRVPTFVNSGAVPSSAREHPSFDGPSLPKSHPSVQLHEQQLDPSISKSKRNKMNECGHQITGKESTKESTQNSKLRLESREQSAEPLANPKASSYSFHVNSALNEAKDTTNRNSMLPQESYRNHTLQTKCSADYREPQKRAEALDGNRSLNPNLADNNRGGIDEVTRSISSGDTGKSSDDSETSMVDSESGYDLSPDDVVGLVGPKHFWKARRAIINQQRVFAVQVFELHRLIKVQKLIAGSPNILLEGSSLLPRSTKSPTATRVATESAIRPHQQTAKQKDDSHNVMNDELMVETAPGPPPPVPCEDGLNRKQPPTPRQSLQNEQSSGNPSAASTGPENRLPGPWCLHPSGKQWLMPVMSPSEGLIYKPVIDAYPPSAGAGFMGHPFGACGPLAAPPIMGDFMNMAYGIPASHQPNMGILPYAGAISPGYFPAAPYGVPVLNPGISSSGIQQVSTFTDAGLGGDSDENSRSSSDNLPLDQQSNSPHVAPEKVQMSRATTAGNNLQGSTASSRNERRPVERTEVSASFVMAPPISEDSMPPYNAHVEACAPRVIKVVPYNRRSASETAARIFQSIQKERLQIS